MPYPIKMNRFASQFTDIAEAFEDDPKTVFTKPMKTRRAADKLRLQFYAFRNSIRRENAIRKQNEQDLMFPALDLVEVLITDQNVITFQCKDYSDIAEDLNDMLRANGLVPALDMPLPIKKA